MSMSFKATVRLIYIYSVHNKSLKLLGDAFVTDYKQFMCWFDDEYVGSYLWDQDIELDKNETAVVKSVRDVEFNVSINEHNRLVFQELGGGIRVTEANNQRLFNMLYDLLEHEITETFKN